MGDRSHEARPTAGTLAQAHSRCNTSTTTHSPAGFSPSRSFTAPRLHASRSTSSMITLQSYPSFASNTFPSHPHTYSHYYHPPLPSDSIAAYHVGSKEAGLPGRAGGCSMYTTKSLGGMSPSNMVHHQSDIISGYTTSCPGVLGSQASNLPPAETGSGLDTEPAQQPSSSSSNLLNNDKYNADDEGLYVSPMMIMNPSTGHSASRSRRTSVSTSTFTSSASNPNVIHSQYTQSRSHTASSPTNHSTYSSPPGNRNLEVTLSPALFAYTAWEPPPALAYSTEGRTAHRSDCSTVPAFQTGSLASTQAQFPSAAYSTMNQMSIEPYADFASHESYTIGTQCASMPDSGYGTQAIPSPLADHTEPAPSSSRVASAFHYAGCEAPPMVSSNSTSALSSTNYGLRPSSSSIEVYRPPRSQSFNNLRSSTHPAGYTQKHYPSHGEERRFVSCSHPYRSRTRQNMQGLLHSDHMDEGFPGEWGSTFRR